MLLLLSHYSLKDVDELKLIIDQNKDLELAEQIPLPVYRWLGSQCYNAGQFSESAKYLTLGCEKGVARTTPAVIWRLLAKAQYKSKQYAAALTSIDNLLSVETEDASRVNGLLDKSQILLGLKKYPEAKETGMKALALRPSGKVKAGLLLAIGDAFFNLSDFASAAEHYVLIVETFSEHEAHSEALYQLIQSLEKQQKNEAAASYKAMLKKDYPNYKAQR